MAIEKNLLRDLEGPPLTRRGFLKCLAVAGLLGPECVSTIGQQKKKSSGTPEGVQKPQASKPAGAYDFDILIQGKGAEGAMSVSAVDKKADVLICERDSVLGKGGQASLGCTVGDKSLKLWHAQTSGSYEGMKVVSPKNQVVPNMNLAAKGSNPLAIEVTRDKVKVRYVSNDVSFAFNLREYKFLL